MFSMKATKLIKCSSLVIVKTMAKTNHFFIFHLIIDCVISQTYSSNQLEMNIIARKLDEPAYIEGQHDLVVNDSYSDYQRTALMDKLSVRQQKHLRKEILNLLGLDHTPKPAVSRRDDAAPRYMMSLYRSLNDGSENSRMEMDVSDEVISNSTATGFEKRLDSADMIMSFVNTAVRRTVNKNDVYRFGQFLFDLRGVTGVTVNSATLRLYKFPVTLRGRDERVKIEVHRLISGETRLETSITVLISFSGWIDINITRAASDWVNYLSGNHGLVIKVINMKGVPIDPAAVSLVGTRGSADKQAFMVAFFKTGPLRSARNKRSMTGDEVDKNSRKHRQEQVFSDEPVQPYSYPNEKFTNKKCQRHALYVSFKDLKWEDWIIAPEGYAAFYCNGECSFPLHAHMNASNHAIVQTLAHLMSPETVPKPCCAPLKLSALSVLYFDNESNVILKKYRNMVVRSCGCH